MHYSHNMNKNKLFLWSLYNFANSIVFITFLVYFSRWLVLDGGVPSAAYNLIFVVVAVLLLLSAPNMASMADIRGNRVAWLRFATAGVAISYMTVALLAHMGMAWPAFFVLIIAYYFFQLAYVFCDPLINDVSDKENRARASGIFQFSSNAGMALGLAASLPLIACGGTLAPLIPAILAFVILAMPMMIFYREDVKRTNKPAKFKIGFDVKRFKKFIMASAAAPFLIAFFFYTNALNTITYNYPIYTYKVLGMTDELTTILLLVNMIAIAIGALIIGFIGDRVGIRRCLFAILYLWLIIIPVVALTYSIPFFFGVAVALGLSIGAGWAASRAYISTQLDTKNLGYGFSFYIIFDRFSSMIGPLAWAGLIAFGAPYQAAMLSMTIFILIGIMVLKYMR